ncbi:mannose-1-phosphate guanylyltransferase [Tenacibaculum tangerinum]|uniref:Mannose-1-phosphate guanylyltransferase n=1 Tax=Tenacibaculum tangerinum TaxID=3038772 RepID=A0ABY8L6L0_9FLAO|nr:mannose-1-phosphate guanylyltransferase [Tenacibaculum tangerinum]WGH75560.1 mannose-1-phosphate guanylyltransferase [Tenacibaculum tangerinum]
MNSNYYAVIMAGGVGSRLWPVSTEKYPKQFHDLLGTGESLLQKTFKRINQLIPSENILIATNKCYEALVLEQLPNISTKQLLLEPVIRNTAPCILYAALKIKQQNEHAVMLVAPSDHWIENEPEFIKNIDTSLNSCTQKDMLLTLGVHPNHPNTGYGYIQFEENAAKIKKVTLFTEKPNLEKATQFLASGNYLWNAGIFVWSVVSIISAFKKHLPEMVGILDSESQLYNTPLEEEFINKNYKKCENISIDFGILEHSQKVYVLPINVGWDDLGTWNSLYKKLPKNNQQNSIVGAKSICNNASGNIVHTPHGKKVVIQGLHDFIVVEKDDVLIICPRKDEQDIKQLRAQAKDVFGKDSV